MSDIIFNRDEDGKPLFIRISSSTTETKREEIMGNFLMAKAPSGEPVLVRATEDGRLMTDGQGGGGGSSDGFLTIGGVTAKEPNDMLYFVAGTGIQIVPDNDLGTITFAVTGGGGGGDVPDGTLTQKGIVQLSNVIDEDESKAATPSSVYWVREIALAAGEVASTDATTEQKGRVQLYPGTDSERDDLAATAGAVREAYLHVEDHVSTHVPGGSDELPLAGIGQYGLTALSSAIDSTADDVAATSSAVKEIADLATKAASGTVAGVVKLYSGVDSSSDTIAATAGSVKKAYDDGTRSGTTAQKGQVQLSSVVDNPSDDLAATAGAVRQANINGTRAATSLTAGQVMLDPTVTSTSTSKAATASAVKKAYDDGTRAATLTTAGQAKLNDTITSTSTSEAATPNAVKKLNDITLKKVMEPINTSDVNLFTTPGKFQGVWGTRQANEPDLTEGARRVALFVDEGEGVAGLPSTLIQTLIYLDGVVSSSIYWRQRVDGNWRAWRKIVDNTFLREGTGSPEGVVTANTGTLYSNKNGGTNTTLYVKQSGTGNTGWVAK